MLLLALREVSIYRAPSLCPDIPCLGPAPAPPDGSLCGGRRSVQSEQHRLDALAAAGGPPGDPPPQRRRPPEGLLPLLPGHELRGRESALRQQTAQARDAIAAQLGAAEALLAAPPAPENHQGGRLCLAVALHLSRGLEDGGGAAAGSVGAGVGPRAAPHAA